MTKESFIEDREQFDEFHLVSVVDMAGTVYQKTQQPVRILDLATGSNGFNAELVRRLSNADIKYELVLTDISPTHFKTGYENATRHLLGYEGTVKAVLADSTDLRRELTEVPIWGEGTATIEEVLRDPENAFLLPSYDGTTRLETFEDESFNIVIGQIPYSSINTGDYTDAVKESARVLKKGGYHIVEEAEVETINSFGLRAYYTVIEMFKNLLEARSTLRRTLSSISRARNDNIMTDVKQQLDSSLRLESVYSHRSPSDTVDRLPEQTQQYGDIVKTSVLTHQK